MLLLVTCLFLLLGFTVTLQKQQRYEDSSLYFPDTIPNYKVRRDKFTNEVVSRGRLRLINYTALNGMIPKNDQEHKAKMVKFADFDRLLQCASPEPDLDGNRGGWSLLKMAPPTKQSIELIAAWAESKCHPWVECRKIAQAYKAGEFDPGMDDLDRIWGMFRGAQLLRVINNEIHYDWPWGIERFKHNEEHYSEMLTDHYALLEMVLRTVSDIGDSVFFFGGERAFLRWNVPFPTFSFAPTLEFGDYPFPWFESYELEAEYDQESERHHNYTDAFLESSQTPWTRRLPKAAFFASFQWTRQLVYDSAALRPDLFDVSFHVNSPMRPWNPLSDEQENKGVPSDPTPRPDRNHPGFLQPLYQFNDGRPYVAHRYKYVIVPVGTGAQSTSGRLAGLLAHSGAVVLLQSSGFSYHFSARLQPWVHYVPLAFSMADLIHKVEWLKHNDDKAQQIVQNARNFARSYLRLEDYFCYAATSLKLISELEGKTDALQAFSPQLI